MGTVSSQQHQQHVVVVDAPLCEIHTKESCAGAVLSLGRSEASAETAAQDPVSSSLCQNRQQAPSSWTASTHPLRSRPLVTSRTSTWTHSGKCSTGIGCTGRMSSLPGPTLTPPGSWSSSRASSSHSSSSSPSCGRSSAGASVSEALRKVSAAKRDIPCSYSRTDINSLGISVNDYLNPPPAYLDLFTDNLQYLDLEQGHNRLAKLSFCNEDGSVPRLARLSVASCENCNTESPCVVPMRSERSSVSSSSVSSSRRQSRTNSRVSFSEEVECSNGSIRRLSTNSLISLRIGAQVPMSRKTSSSSSSSSSRKSSSSSEGSRRSSLKSLSLQRKFGSVSDDSFVACLDEDLRRKLDSIGLDDEKAVRQEEDKRPVSAESQAERAARICDIIVEEK